MPNPNIIFIADGGPGIGLGHLRRCLSLAGAAQRLGAIITFAVPDLPTFINMVGEQGHHVVAFDFQRGFFLNKQAASFTGNGTGYKGFGPATEPSYSGRSNYPVFVLDSYRFSAQNAAALLKYLCPDGFFLAVIDDFGRRYPEADLVLNDSMNRNSFTEGKTRYLYGYHYALLRPEFAGLPYRQVDITVKRVMITLGGSDPAELSPALALAIIEALPGVMIDLVWGPLFPVEIPRAVLEHPLIAVHRNPPEMALLMLSADLAVTGGGQTLFELAATGTPAVVLQIADNQAQNIAAFAAAGVISPAGRADSFDITSKTAELCRTLAKNIKTRQAMAEAGQSLIDGRGAERAAGKILRIFAIR